MSQTRAQLVKGLSNTSGSDDTITVASNGRVGINKSSPSQKLHVEDSGSNVYVRVTETGNTGIDFGQATDGNGVINLRDNADIQILTNGVEELRVLAAGGLTFNGDTAAANALDDYEEGAWTPDLRFGGGTTGITYTNRVGKYVKIGRLVWVTCRVVLSNKGSDTGSAQVFGLPYDTSTESNTHLTPGAIWFTSASVQGSPLQTIIRTDGNNQGYIEIRNLTTGNEDVFDHSDVNNDFQFAFSLTYLSQ